MFGKGRKMRDSRTHQPLTYDVRLPDEAQADALRLLDATKVVVNTALTMLWPSLDAFGSERASPAWKQVGKYIGSPFPHGDRQWRCESEVVGRTLRQQAERKKAFELVLPMLSEGFIRPKTEQRPVGKNRPAIKEAIAGLHKSLDEDETSFVTLQNVVEQACNYFFQHDRFPASYEELQPVPRLQVGMLTYAGDDGREKGQAYRLAFDLDAGTARFRFQTRRVSGSGAPWTPSFLYQLVSKSAFLMGSCWLPRCVKNAGRMESGSPYSISSSRSQKESCPPGRASRAC
jgi:putative transposase